MRCILFCIMLLQFFVMAEPLYYSGSKIITVKKMNKIKGNSSSEYPEFSQSLDFRMTGNITGSVSSDVDISSRENRNIVSFFGKAGKSAKWSAGYHELNFAPRNLFSRKTMTGFSVQGTQQGIYAGRSESIPAKKTFVSSGGSGPYFLSTQRIIPDSEQVYIEYEKLEPNYDYSIDYENGTLFFTRPVLSRKEITVYFEEEYQQGQTVFGGVYNIFPGIKAGFSAAGTGSSRTVFSVESSFERRKWNNSVNFSVSNTEDGSGAGLFLDSVRSISGGSMSASLRLSEPRFYSFSEKIAAPVSLVLAARKNLFDIPALVETHMLQGDSKTHKLRARLGGKNYVQLERKIASEEAVSMFETKYSLGGRNGFLAVENQLMYTGTDFGDDNENRFSATARTTHGRLKTLFSAESRLRRTDRITTADWNSRLNSTAMITGNISFINTASVTKSGLFQRNASSGFGLRFRNIYWEALAGSANAITDNTEKSYNTFNGKFKYSYGRSYALIKQSRMAGMSEKNSTEYALNIARTKYALKSTASFTGDSRIFREAFKFRIGSRLKCDAALQWNYEEKNFTGKNAELNFDIITAFSTVNLGMNYSENDSGDGLLDSELSFELKL